KRVEINDHRGPAPAGPNRIRLIAIKWRALSENEGALPLLFCYRRIHATPELGKKDCCRSRDRADRFHGLAASPSIWRFPVTTDRFWIREVILKPRTTWSFWQFSARGARSRDPGLRRSECLSRNESRIRRIPLG